jgi:tripartite-type tricarboxylate transporter receptor subunit TctC
MRLIEFVKPWLASCLLAGTAALAQGFPGKVVTLVVPYPAGGGSDAVARVVAPELSKQLGQPVIVENVSGAAGAIGVQKVVSAAADGNTMLIGSPMELVLTPLSIAAAKYKPEDLRLLGLWSSTSMVLLARKDLPANNVEELIELAKRSAAKEVSYGSIGPGSLYHLVAERFTQLSGTKMLHVPYKGGAPLVQDLIGGQIDIVFMPLAGNIPDLITSGKVKALGLAAASRHSTLSQIPLIKETKGMDEFVFGLWNGLQVGKGVPQEVATRLNKLVGEVAAKPEVRQAILMQGTSPVAPTSLDELARQYEGDIARFRAIAKSINLQPQ